MTPQPPPGQGPIDPMGAFVPPPNPVEAGGPPAGPVGGPARPPLPQHAQYPGPGPGYGPGGGAGAWPPGWPPPPYPYPPPPAPRRGGWGRALVFLVLLLIVGGSVALNVGLLAAALGGGSDDEPPVVKTTLTAGDTTQQVAVVALSGEINEPAADWFNRLIDAVEKDKDVRALVVEIDSPGGTVTASDEIYDRLIRYKAARSAAGRPAGVVIAMRSMATSGGYYVACAGDHLIAEPTTMTGNIGVLMSRINFSGVMEKYGVKETTIVATGADFKNAGSPYAPETEQARTYLTGIADDAFARFKQVVTTGRGPKLSAASPADVFNGKVFTANEALKLGLIDQIGYPHDAYAHAATKVAGLSKPHVVRYREPAPGLIGVLFGGGGGASSSAASAGAGVPRAGAPGTVNVPFDLRPETFDAWRTNRLLYR